MSLLALFAAAFLTALSGALAPGPMLTMTVSWTLKKGPWSGPLFVLGHMILEIMFLVLIWFGLAPLLVQPLPEIFIFSAGSLCLLVMALLTLRDSRMAYVPLQKNKGGNDFFFGPVLAGVFASLSNPYWTVWWLTIGLGYFLKASEYGWKGRIIFFAGHILADLLWYSFVSFGISRTRKFISVKVYRAVLLVCAVILAGFSFWFGYSAFARIRDFFF